MENLFPEESILDEDDAIQDYESSSEPNYVPGLKIDPFTNDFVISGAGKIVDCTETESWIQWCKKVLETPRYQCIAYSDDIGIDIESIIVCVTREERESMLFSEISDALAADPYNRTSYVESVLFGWHVDSVDCMVSVVGNDGSRANIDVEMSFSGGGSVDRI